jgi:hypothetical protein
MLLMVGAAAHVIGRFWFKAPIVAGMLVLVSAMGLFGLVSSEGSYVSDVLWASLIAAAGMSLAYIPALNTGLAALPPEQGGLASGVLGVSYQVGSAVGLAVITSIATSYGANELGNVARLTDGFQAAFIATAGVALAGALVALAFVRGGRPSPEQPQEQAQDERDEERELVAA